MNSGRRGVIPFSLFVLWTWALTGAAEKPQWKGKIAAEGGLKVVKNPDKALYGNIKYELVYARHVLEEEGYEVVKRYQIKNWSALPKAYVETK